MTKAILISVIFFTTLLSHKVSAQFYYQDIVNNKKVMAEKNTYQSQKVRKITIHSFEGDKSPSKGFFCEKNISKNYRTIETYTKSAQSGNSLFIAEYNADGQLKKTVDSSDILSSYSLYEYDTSGNLVSITQGSKSYDEDYTAGMQEVRKYKYDTDNKPVQLQRIKNGRDSVLIDFVKDAKGNITDEIEPGKNGKHFYYYYDDKNRLTDIVKYNYVKQGLRPDFIFEYDDQNQLTQMVTVEEGVSGDYNTWEYIYNDEGLRIIEKCFSRQKELLGYIEYEYD